MEKMEAVAVAVARYGAAQKLMLETGLVFNFEEWFKLFVIYSMCNAIQSFTFSQAL